MGYTIDKRKSPEFCGFQSSVWPKRSYCEAHACRRERLQAMGQGPSFYFDDLGLAVPGYGSTNEAEARKIAEALIEDDLMEGIDLRPQARDQTGARSKV